MKHKLLPLSIVALIAVLLVAISFSWYGDQGKVVSTKFPEKTSHRVELRPESDKEVLRVSYVKKTGETVITEIQYTNGVTSYLFYQENGKSLAKVLDFYPEDSVGQTDRRLKAETYFMESGELLANHTAYREDGSVLRRGVRQPDNTYKTNHYKEDGISVDRQRAFDEEQKLVSDFTYFPDGTVKVKIEKTASGSTYLTTTFREDGTKFSVATSGYNNSFSGTYFWEDGSTVKAKLKTLTWRIEYQHHNKAGVKEYTVTYRPDSKAVEGFNAEGKLLFQQEYDLVGERENVECGGTYVLTEVTQYHKWGQYAYQKKTFQVVEFAEDGVTPIKVTVPTSNGLKFIYTLDENGVVIKVEETGERRGYGAGDSVDGAVSFKVGDKVNISPDLVKANEFECLPIPEQVEVTDPNPYRYYGPF